MAAISAGQVSLYPIASGSSECYVGGVSPREVLARRLKIDNVTAGDVASADVLGFSRLHESSNAFCTGTGATVAMAVVNPVLNQLVIGTGPAAVDVHVTVTGTPKTTP